MWGEYIYIYGKATSSAGPWLQTRKKYGMHTSIRRVNDESEEVVMTDYPKSMAKRYYNDVKWKINFVHYNALMKDNSAKTVSNKENVFLQWMFNNNRWGG